MAWRPAMVVVLTAVLATSCANGERDSGVPSMSEIECQPFDGTNSTSGGPDSGAATPEGALGAFAAEGFLNLDETRGQLRITRRSAKTARAEYVMEGSVRAVLFLKRASDWRVNGVAWCGSLDRN